MLALLSPAKNLDFSPCPIPVEPTTPALMAEAEALMRTTRGLSQRKIAELMSLSKDLAKLNYDRFQSFELPFSTNNALPAAFAFNGDVYRGLAARTLSVADLAWAQDRIAILSGLYGIVRPLDLIQAYRLEMGTPLKTRRGQSLYAWWGDRIANRIAAVVADQTDPTLVNLASGEYWKAVQTKKLATPIVHCLFEDWKHSPDDGTVISFLAKQARGKMARFIITERLDRVVGLKDFAVDRYRFQAKRSTTDKLVFARQFVPVAAG